MITKLTEEKWTASENEQLIQPDEDQHKTAESFPAAFDSISKNRRHERHHSSVVINNAEKFPKNRNKPNLKSLLWPFLQRSKSQQDAVFTQFTRFCLLVIRVSAATFWKKARLISVGITLKRILATFLTWFVCAC